MRPPAPAGLFLLLALSSAGSPAGPQEEPAETFAEEVEVTEVLLDVVVTDRDDRLILGLGREDFIVVEGRQQVEIASVSFYSSRRLLESSELLARRGVEVDVVPQDRTFIVFVQEQRRESIARPTLYQRQARAGSEVERWLVEVAQPADRVAVVSFNRRLKVHQDFTSDRRALLAAVEGAFRGREPEGIPPSRRIEVDSEPTALSSLPTGRELRRASGSIYGALRLLAGAVAEVPGRKNLLFFGTGFGGVGTYGRYERELGKLNPTLRALNDANVAVYSLDLFPPGIAHSDQMALRDLAAATGGRLFIELWGFARPLAEISDLNSGYYLLSYQSRRPAGESGYQRVRVGTRNREFRVYAREGYRYGSP